MTYEIFYIYDVKKRKPMVFPTLSFLASLVVNFVMHASLSFFGLGFFLFCYFLSAFGFWRSIAFWVECFSDFLVLFFLVLIFQFFLGFGADCFVRAILGPSRAARAARREKLCCRHSFCLRIPLYDVCRYHSK